jgi:hypothetical protein
VAIELMRRVASCFHRRPTLDRCSLREQIA